MIPEDIRAEIMDRLHRVAQQENVKILLAIESGSRAWGFASPDSDYDVRFIYLRPKDWYLSVGLEEKRDVIEHPIIDDIDLNGWDVRKALRLFWRSNPAFAEWVQSPIIYIESGPFAARVRELLPSIYALERGIYHYRSMARSNFRTYLQADQVPLKKYLYVLRPLLCVRWIDAYGTPAPIEFQKLLHLLEDPALLADIEVLVERKSRTSEVGLSDPIPSIAGFIQSELDRLEAIEPGRSERLTDLDQLDDLFRILLGESPQLGSCPRFAN